ncbi:hypothetical protein [Streptomyces flavidovirens]|uniref:hypothetical protein n=1 Tax=Streptomyces flavidovirens TaxID=67298 RepID=UPI0003FD0E8C|nr:hypothetical protein [Streptomyces flavidovirens]
MNEHELASRGPVRPVRDHRTAERVIKAILIVAAVVAAIVVPFMCLVIATYAMAD